MPAVGAAMAQRAPPCTSPTTCSRASTTGARLQVVGLVHGGARCAIAAPTAGLGDRLAALSRPHPPRLARRGEPLPRPGVKAAPTPLR